MIIHYQRTAALAALTALGLSACGAGHPSATGPPSNGQVSRDLESLMLDKKVLWNGKTPLCVHSVGNEFTCKVGNFTTRDSVFVDVTDDGKTILASGLPSN